MGQVISAAIALQDDLELVAGVDVKPSVVPSAFPVFSSLEACSVAADVVIDFSHPDSLFTLLPQAAAKKLAVVIATTGLEEKQQEFIQTYSKVIPIFYSANMSLGINLVKDLIKKSASVLGRGFDIEIIEMHHRLKKDAPSGTALLLLQGLNEVLEPPMTPVNGRDSKDRLRTVNEIGIHAVRGGTLVGEHDVIFAGTDELVQVSHKAYSRQIFASGALKAARYIAAKRPGFYSMDKMIGEDNVVTNLYVADNEVLITIGNIPAKMSVVTSLYGSLSNDDINIDMISQTLQPGDLMTISFSLFSRDLEKAEKIIKNLIGEYPTVFYRCDSDIAKITVEGPGMEQQSGVAYKFFACLEKDQITVKAVSTSETKISAIVNSADREAASSLLKDAFLI
jgi:4-hydroxy-tetrahydrodipicolinate reductase